MPAAAASSRRASAPAAWKAASEESTECALPSTRVRWTSTSGRSPLIPRWAWVRMPFSTLPWNWLGTVPPTMRCSNTTPEPGGPGSASTTTTAYCPWPPDCLTCRPVTRAGPARVSTIGTRTGTVVTATPWRVRSRSSSTSACASPTHQSSSCPVSGRRSSRTVGSSATSRASAVASRSSSAREAASTATGSCGVGRSQGGTSRGSSGEDRVSPVSALTSRATAQMSPAGQAATGRSAAPSGEEIAPTRSSTSWSGCPRSARPWPETCTGMSGRRVPEKTRTSDTRPR